MVDVVLDALWGSVAFAAVALDADGSEQLHPLPLDAFDDSFLRRTARPAHRLTPVR